MSNVIQSQMVTQVTATLTNAAVTTVNIPRPQTTPAQPAYAENVDHVTAPSHLRDDEGGHMQIRLPAAFAAANVFLRRVSIWQNLPVAQKGVPTTALFPSGVTTNASFVRDIVNLTGNTLATNSNTVLDMFGVPADSATVRSYPGITLMAGQYVRLEIFNNSGGDLGPAVIDASYKMGLNQGDTGKP